MTLTKNQRSVIERVTNAFETGTADGDYGAISIYHDGPNKVRQITYGAPRRPSSATSGSSSKCTPMPGELTAQRWRHTPTASGMCR